MLGLMTETVAKAQEAEKACVRCGEAKLLSEYWADAGHNDGHASVCKACRKVYKRQWKARNPDAVQSEQEHYRIRHHGEIKARYQRWYYERGGKLVALYHVRRRRAQKRGVNEYFDVAMQQHVLAFWHNQCAICSWMPLPLFPETLHIDHWKPLSKGYALTMSNAVIMCQSCNNKKSASMPADFYDAATVARIESEISEQALLWGG